MKKIFLQKIVVFHYLNFFKSLNSVKNMKEKKTMNCSFLLFFSFKFNLTLH
jgi:hypothetical protein